MNIYEQLMGVKSDLQARNAQPKTIGVIDKMIGLAESQRDSALSMSRLQVLRRAMQTRDVLNDEDIRLDFIALEGDLEEEAAARSNSTAQLAYEETDHRPKLKKFYKKK
ncbi:MAG: hypothetical protein ACR2JC_18000 [Chloroflexota bacterium]